MYHIDFTRCPFDGPFHFEEVNQFSIREHDHSFCEIAVVMAGHGWHSSGGQMLSVQERDVFVIPVGTPHCWLHDCDLQLLNIYYRSSLLLPLIDPADPLRSVFFTGEVEKRHLPSAIHMRIAPQTLHEIRSELQQFDRESELGSTFRTGCFLKILARLQRDYSLYYGMPPFVGQMRPPVFRLMEALDQYALSGEPLNLEREAARYGLSADQAARLFREDLTISPYKFFNRRRLRRAEWLLTVTAKSCTEIAYELGFSDAAHFSRTFREHHGVSPAEWRRQMLHKRE